MGSQSLLLYLRLLKIKLHMKEKRRWPRAPSNRHCLCRRHSRKRKLSTSLGKRRSLRDGPGGLGWPLVNGLSVCDWKWTGRAVNREPLHYGGTMPRNRLSDVGMTRVNWLYRYQIKPLQSCPSYRARPTKRDDMQRARRWIHCAKRIDALTCSKSAPVPPKWPPFMICTGMGARWHA